MSLARRVEDRSARRLEVESNGVVRKESKVRSACDRAFAEEAGKRDSGVCQTRSDLYHGSMNAMPTLSSRVIKAV